MNKNQRLKKNQSSSILNDKSQKAVNWFSEISITSLNSERIWKTIEDRLEKMDKHVLSWFMAMATSFTLLVAAGLEYGPDFEFRENITPFIKLKEIEQSFNNKVVEKSTVSYSHQLNNKVKSKAFLPPTNLKISKTQVPSRRGNITTVDKVKKNNNKNRKQKISIQGQASYIENNILPGIGIDLKLFETYKNAKYHSFHLGYSGSASFSKTNSESEKARTHFFSFVKLGYGITNIENKGWQIESGYLLNPDGELFENTTIKMSVHRKINKHIRVGPDIIFTNNFEKVLPSVTVLISS
ncbi:MAG: hypothetical protein JXR07_13820 [Reichenbachiella sp.]